MTWNGLGSCLCTSWAIYIPKETETVIICKNPLFTNFFFRSATSRITTKFMLVWTWSIPSVNTLTYLLYNSFSCRFTRSIISNNGKRLRHYVICWRPAHSTHFLSVTLGRVPWHARTEAAFQHTQGHWCMINHALHSPVFVPLLAQSIHSIFPRIRTKMLTNLRNVSLILMRYPPWMLGSPIFLERSKYLSTLIRYPFLKHATLVSFP